ncbi:MAG: NYN domain-containing protein [Candidatus Methanodesulfokora sp.]
MIGGSKLKVLRTVKKAVKRKQIAVVVDGPNMLRKDLNVDLETVRRIIMDVGRPVISIVILDRKAPEKLVEAVNNAGFKPIISAGKVEVDFTIAAMDAIYMEKIDSLILVARSAAYLPLIHKAKEKGKEVVVIGTEPGFSIALKKAADKFVSLSESTELSPPETEGEEEEGYEEQYYADLEEDKGLEGDDSE